MTREKTLKALADGVGMISEKLSEMAKHEPDLKFAEKEVELAFLLDGLADRLKAIADGVPMSGIEGEQNRQRAR